MDTETVSLVFEYQFYLEGHWAKPFACVLRRSEVPMLDHVSDQWTRTPYQVENGTVIAGVLTAPSSAMSEAEAVALIEDFQTEVAIDHAGVLFQRTAGASNPHLEVEGKESDTSADSAV